MTGGDTRPEGVVSVALPEFYAVKLLAPALTRFHAAYPAITLDVRTGHGFLNLARGEADIACRNRRPEHNTLVARRVGYGAKALYASRGYLEKHGPPKDGDFAGHSLLLFDETLAGFPGSDWVEARLKGAHVVMRTNEIMPLLTAAKEGAGPAFLPALATRGEPDLRPVWPGILSMTDCFVVTRRDSRQQARVRAVFDFIVRLCTECAGDLSGAAVAEIFGDRGGFGPVNAKRRKPEVPSSDRPESTTGRNSTVAPKA